MPTFLGSGLGACTGVFGFSSVGEVAVAGGRADLKLTASVFAGSELVEHLLKDHLSETLWNLRSPLRGAKYLTVLVTVLVGFFIELIRRLTIFTTISTFGLFLGTGALVLVPVGEVLYFKADLRSEEHTSELQSH